MIKINFIAFFLLLTIFLFLPQFVPGSNAFGSQDGLRTDQAYIDVEKYTLWLELFPQRHAISGEVEIEVAAGNEAAASSGEIVLYLHEDIALRELCLYPGGETPDYKRFSNTIKFRTAHKFDKIYASFYGDPSRYITPKNSFTYIGPEGCYFDDLCAYFPRAGFDVKSRFEAFITHYDDWQIISQGEGAPATDVKTPDRAFKAGSEQRRTVTTRVVNNKKTRCHTLAAGPYIKKSKKDIKPYGYNVSAYFFENEREAAEAHLDEAINILNYYREHYGSNGIKKLSVVEVEKVFPGGYGPEEVVYITASAVNGGAVDYQLLAHEIAHQWFGNFVMGEFPGSNFLNEAFATYASLEYIKDRRAKYYHREYEKARRQYLSYRSEAATREITIEAAKTAEGGRDYQAIIYYRAMMVLKNLLYFMAKAAEVKESNIIAGFLEKYAEQTVTVDEFKNFLFNTNDGIFSKISLRDRKSFEAAKFYFDKFYCTTAAVELQVKEALIKEPGASARGITLCAMTIERMDEIQRDIDIIIGFYNGADNELICKKSFIIKRGTNKLDIALDGFYKDVKYRIDEENAYPLSYKIHCFGERIGGSEKLVIYDASEAVSSRFSSLCRELALQAGDNVKSDRTFNANDFLKYRDILLIGNFADSPLAGLINSAFNFRISPEKIETQKCFNREVFYFKNGTAAKFTAKNPFIDGGALTAVLFFDRAAAGAYNKLQSGLDDFCVYDTKTKELITGNYNYGLCGTFETAGGIKLLYGGAGLNGNIIAARPSAFILDLYNPMDSTVEAEIEIAAGKRRGEVPANAAIALPPRRITRHESFPFIFNRQAIDYKIKNKNGAPIYEGTLSAKSFSPGCDSFAVAASKDEEFNKISAAINFLNSNTASNAAYPGRRRQANIINADFENCPLNPVCYNAFKAVILNNYDLAAARPGFAGALKSYAASGGRVIISGGEMSLICSEATKTFMQEIFGAKISSSTLYSFDDSIAGVRARQFQPGFYMFCEQPWHDCLMPSHARTQTSNSALSAKKTLSAPGDNPVITYGRKNFHGGRIEEAVPLFGSKLIMRRFGGGVFYYLPYDFSDDLLGRSFENSYILTVALHGGPFTGGPLISGETPERIFFDPQEHPWPFTVSYFLIFIFAYISALAAVYIRAAKNKSGGGYLFELAGVVCFFSISLPAAVYFFTLTDCPPQALGFTEISDGFCGPGYETVYYKIWPGNKIKSEIEFDGRFVSHNYSSSYSNKIEFFHTKNGFKLNIYNPLIFHPLILATRNVIQPCAADSPLSIKAIRPADKNFFCVRISPDTFNYLNISGEAALLIKTPNGFFTALHACRGAAEYSFANARILDFNAACGEIKETLALPLSLTYAMREAINEYSEKIGDKSKPVIFILSGGEFGLKESGAADGSKSENGFNKYKKLNIAAAPLDFIDEKQSVIPDFSFCRKAVNINGTLYTRLYLNSAHYINSLLERGAGGAANLCAYINIKIPDGSTRNEIENYADFFIKSFDDNFKINDMPPNSSYIKYKADEIYKGDIFLNIIHDNKKNFSYNIADRTLTIKIINLSHYLNYNLYDAGGEIAFFINNAALTWKQEPVDFNVSIKYE